MGRLKRVPQRLVAVRPRLAAPAIQSERERLRRRDQDRPNWYGSKAWKDLRLRRLKHDRWTCQATGVLLVGTYPAWNSAVVDHVEPHRWDPDLFWDFDNLQSMTKQWHDREKQRIEAGSR